MSRAVANCSSRRDCRGQKKERSRVKAGKKKKWNQDQAHLVLVGVAQLALQAGQAPRQLLALGAGVGRAALLLRVELLELAQPAAHHAQLLLQRRRLFPPDNTTQQDSCDAWFPFGPLSAELLRKSYSQITLNLHSEDSPRQVASPQSCSCKPNWQTNRNPPTTACPSAELLLQTRLANHSQSSIGRGSPTTGGPYAELLSQIPLVDQPRTRIIQPVVALP